MSNKEILKELIKPISNTSAFKILSLNSNKYKIPSKPYFSESRHKEDLKIIKIAMEKFSIVRNNLFDFETDNTNTNKEKNVANENSIHANIKSNIHKNSLKNNSEYQKVYGKDDEYWENYSKKAKKGKSLIAPMDSQEFQINETDNNWKYYKNHSMLAGELYDELINLTNENPPFMVLDIREESELELFSFPLRNKKGVKLPILHKTVSDINYRNYQEIPLNKYIVVIDSIGLRSRRICHQLMMESGLITMYVEGGLDKLFLHINKGGL